MLMTSEACSSGSERIAWLAAKLVATGKAESAADCESCIRALRYSQYSADQRAGEPAVFGAGLCHRDDGGVPSA